MKVHLLATAAALAVLSSASAAQANDPKTDFLPRLLDHPQATRAYAYDDGTDCGVVVAQYDHVVTPGGEGWLLHRSWTTTTCPGGFGS